MLYGACPAGVIFRVSIAIHICICPFCETFGVSGLGARCDDLQCHDRYDTAPPAQLAGLGGLAQLEGLPQLAGLPQLPYRRASPCCLGTEKVQSSLLSSVLHGRTSCCPVNLPQRLQTRRSAYPDGALSQTHLVALEAASSSPPSPKQMRQVISPITFFGPKL